ncbi:MAG: serine hydrolase [Patescibacteria group bacterium]
MNKLKITLVSALLFIGVTNIVPQSVQFVSPVSENRSVFDSLITRLEQKKNNYSVHKERSIIPEVYADNGITNVTAYALIDYDSGKVLAESNLSTRLPIASITKIMTAVVALDLADPDEVITISEHAANMIPTKIGVIAGQKMTLRELLNAALLTSANDATQAIADGIDAKYGEPVFIKSMNEKAAFLNLKNTHFTNPQGFDNPEHYSSVEDLAVLNHYAMQYPLIVDTVKKESEFLPPSTSHKQFDLPNWNGIIGVYPKTIGMKIGNTDNAKFTTVVLSEREGRKILAVVLGASNTLDRDMKAAELLDMGYQMTMGLKPVNITVAQLQQKYGSWSKFF